MFKQKRQGFTLIELLIVISILALLVGVVIFLLNPTEILNKARVTSAEAYAVKGCQAVQICNVKSDTGTCLDPVAVAGAPASPVTWVGTPNATTVATTVPLIAATTTTCVVSCTVATGVLTRSTDCAI